MTIQRLLTTRQASDALACSIRTIYRYIQRGEDTAGAEGLWPIIKRETGVILIPEATITNYIQRQCVS